MRNSAAESLHIETAGPGGAKSHWPARLTAICGEVLIRIDGSKLWTLRGIQWRGTVFGVEDSEYGTVVDYQNEGPIGAGHQEIESEVVTGFEVVVDGEEMKDVSGAVDVRAQSVRIARTSNIRTFLLDAALQVGDDVVVQSVRIRNSRDVAVKSLYALMYAWTPYATEYLFVADDGDEASGEFQQGEKKYFVESGKRWVAVYDAAVRRGAVSCVVQEPAAGQRCFLVADVPTIYRKIYLKCFAESVVPAGFDGTYRVATGFFSVPEGHDWKQESRRRAGVLRNQFSC
jgi:hypothetical protein